MRVLMACEQDCDRYVSGLCEALSLRGVDLHCGLREFWLVEGQWDLIHLQWPEALYSWKEPAWANISFLLNDVLPRWQQRAKIIITRHNAYSHHAHVMEWRSLYDHIYKFVDGIIHLGHADTERFTSEMGLHKLQQTVIPHPVFSGYGLALHRTEARRSLGIPINRTVVLVFGRVRHTEQRILAQNAFLRLPVHRKVLLAPTFGAPIRPVRRRPLPWMIWELRNREILWPRQFMVGNQTVPDDRVHLYFSAADVVLLPRINTLNSGVLPLAFQYGRVVVGPKVGNMGPILETTGNPTFDPVSVVSCAEALVEGLELERRGHGERNARYAASNWSMDRVSGLHQAFYHEVLQDGIDRSERPAPRVHNR